MELEGAGAEPTVLDLGTRDRPTPSPTPNAAPIARRTAQRITQNLFERWERHDRVGSMFEALMPACDGSNWSRGCEVHEGDIVQNACCRDSSLARRECDHRL